MNPVVTTESPNEIKRHNLNEHQCRESQRRNKRQATQADRVLVCLAKSDFPLTRNQIAKRLNLPVSSVCGRVNTLFSEGWVDPIGTVQCPVTKSTAHALICTESGQEEALFAAERVAYSDSLKAA